jgi:hypothetical protein
VFETVCVPDVDGDEVPEAEIVHDADAEEDALGVDCPAVCMKSKMQKTRRLFKDFDFIFDVEAKRFSRSH